jgi:hypothetical protein
MRGGESVKEDMMGKSLTGRAFFWRRKHFEGEDIFFCGDLWCEEFGFGVFGESEAGGTGLLGVLGTGARISLRYPGAREPDRLLLAGREENSVLGSV